MKKNESKDKENNNMETAMQAPVLKLILRIIFVLTILIIVQDFISYLLS